MSAHLPRIGIVDYSVGNLRSVQKALETVGVGAEVLMDPCRVADCDKLILPGVGAFRDAIAALRANGMDRAVLEHIAAGKPFLGICLGLQMLLELSHEDGRHTGLGLVPGEVVRFPESLTLAGLKIPHMGWNQLWWDCGPADREDSTHPGSAHDRSPRISCQLLRGLNPGCYVYFVHSYFADPRDRAWVAAETDYGGRFCSVLSRGNVHAVQFHPEKSQTVGLRILRNFAE